jgi:hypothetical protein
MEYFEDNLKYAGFICYGLFSLRQDEGFPFKSKKNPDRLVGATGYAVTNFFFLLPPVNGRNDFF